MTLSNAQSGKVHVEIITIRVPKAAGRKQKKYSQRNSKGQRRAGHLLQLCRLMKRYLRIDISLQKSSIFSAVKSCSRKILMATSVPFHVPRKTSPKNPRKQ